MLTDADADNVNSLFFVNGTNKYDILILGHQEYVTQQEYANLKHFVANGGTLVLMDGNVFYAEVKYDRNTHFLRTYTNIFLVSVSKTIAETKCGTHMSSPTKNKNDKTEKVGLTCRSL